MTTGNRPYQAQYRKGGLTRRISLGRHGNVTTQQARLKAQEAMGLVAKRDNPAEEIAYPMRRALAFAKDIRSSKPIRDEFTAVVDEYLDQNSLIGRQLQRLACW